MKIALYSLHPFERAFLEDANREHGHELVDLRATLRPETAALARGFSAVSLFAHDKADAQALATLAEGGTRLLVLRSAGYNHVDLEAAAKLDIRVARVPAYSPYAIAEHAVGLMLTLNRRLHRAVQRTRELDFSLEGLLGFDFHGKTVGIVGTGKIGSAVARILHGFGCRLLGADPQPDHDLEALGLRYVPLPELLAESDVISLHCPLVPATHHLIDARAVASMKEGVMLINTCRGGVIDTRAVIAGLKSKKIGFLGLDVYEVEDGVFFKDLSADGLDDDVLARLLTFPNVVVTAHQGFFTREALQAIAETTLENASAFAKGALDPANEVRAAAHLR